MRVEILLSEEHGVAMPATELAAAELFNGVRDSPTPSEFRMDQWQHCTPLQLYSVKFESFTKKHFARELALRKLTRYSVQQNSSFTDDVRAVGYFQSLMNVVIG